VITDHVWRSMLKLGGEPNRLAVAAQACAYMNCRRPPAEHARIYRRFRSS